MSNSSLSCRDAIISDRLSFICVCDVESAGGAVVVVTVFATVAVKTVGGEDGVIRPRVNSCRKVAASDDVGMTLGLDGRARCGCTVAKISCAVDTGSAVGLFNSATPIL